MKSKRRRRGEERQTYFKSTRLLNLYKKHKCDLKLITTPTKVNIFCFVVVVVVGYLCC